MSLYIISLCSVEIFEYHFELFKRYVSVLIDVIPIENLLQFMLFYLVAKLRHGLSDVLSSYFPFVFYIKLVEYSKQAVLSENTLNLYSCR